MKKTLIKITKRVLLMILILSLALTGCAQGEEGFEYGFNTPNGLYTSYRVAIKSERKIFDISNVTFEFFFGIIMSADIEFEKEHSHNFGQLDIYFENNDGDRHFIKTTSERLTSEEYRVSLTRPEKFQFNHSEKLTIPAILFTAQSGEIFFTGYATDENQLDNGNIGVLAGRIFYKKTGTSEIEIYDFAS